MLSTLPLSLPCQSVWTTRNQPASPEQLLAALPEEADKAKRLGAQLLDFPGDFCVVEAEYRSQSLWEQVAAVLRESELGATLHLPQVWVDLAALDEYVWEGSIRSVETALLATLPLKPEMAVVHPANYGTQMVLEIPGGSVLDTSLLRRLKGRLTSALKRLSDTAAGPVLALENLEGMPFDLFALIITETETKACLDLGHAVSNGDDPATALRSLANDLAGIHLHDALAPRNGALIGEAHLPLGQGELDLKDIRQALIDIDFSGPVVLEIASDVAESVQVLKAAWPGFHQASDRRGSGYQASNNQASDYQGL